jgi:hypothetical protein
VDHEHKQRKVWRELQGPPDSLHLSLPGFDTERGIFFVNVGDGDSQKLERLPEIRFLGSRLRHQIQFSTEPPFGWRHRRRLRQRGGYVGIGEVTAAVAPVADFRFGPPECLSSAKLGGGALRHHTQVHVAVRPGVAARVRAEQANRFERHYSVHRHEATRQIVTLLAQRSWQLI